MTETEKLESILENINTVISLVEDNKYEQYFIRHLIPIEVEVKRQMALIADGKEVV